MNVTVKTDGDPFKGIISLPGSKSISNRLLIIRALCLQDFDILYLSDSKDTKDLQEIMRTRSKMYNTGEGGTTTRFFISYAALKQYQCVIDASGRMCSRPVKGLIDSLNQLGARISYVNNDERLPVQLKGYRLKGDVVELSATESSQFASSLALIAPYIGSGLAIQLKGELVSEPYLGMTLALMRDFGVDASITKNLIQVSNGIYSPRTYIVEADWSSASYWYTVAALRENCELFLSRLKIESLQGDKVLHSIMQIFGVDSRIELEGIRLFSTGDLPQKFEYDFKNCPDIALSLIVCCAALGVEASIKGLQTLVNKESNRVEAIKSELAKLNIDIQIKADNEVYLALDKARKRKLSEIREVVFDSHGDHRIAMALSAFAAIIKQVTITNAEVVNKSYPNYWADLSSLGISTVLK